MKKCNEIALLDRFLYESTNTECIIVDIELGSDFGLVSGRGAEFLNTYTYAYFDISINEFTKVRVSKNSLLRNYTRYQHYETIT